MKAESRAWFSFWAACADPNTPPQYQLNENNARSAAKRFIAGIGGQIEISVNEVKAVDGTLVPLHFSASVLLHQYELYGSGNFAFVIAGAALILSAGCLLAVVVLVLPELQRKRARIA